MDKIFNKPFAVNGARVAIPENGTENERVSFDKGFTQPYEIEAPSVDNPAGQGFNILRPEMNEILNQLSNACNFLAENIDKWTTLTTENLNNIDELGRYYQSFNSQATNERNYPEPYAGYLIVINQGIDGGAPTQIYKPYNSDNVYLRKKSGANWSVWDRLILKSEFLQELNKKRNISDSYSQQETQVAVGNLVQILNNGDFINPYRKNKISVFATGRAFNMVENSWIDVQLRCTTTGEIGATGTWYASGGAKDATICLSATFNTNGLDRLYFALEPMHGGGQITYFNFVGVFFD